MKTGLVFVIFQCPTGGENSATGSNLKTSRWNLLPSTRLVFLPRADV